MTITIIATAAIITAAARTTVTIIEVTKFIIIIKLSLELKFKKSVASTSKMEPRKAKCCFTIAIAQAKG